MRIDDSRLAKESLLIRRSKNFRTESENLYLHWVCWKLCLGHSRSSHPLELTANGLEKSLNGPAYFLFHPRCHFIGTLTHFRCHRSDQNDLGGWQAEYLPHRSTVHRSVAAESHSNGTTSG